MSKAVLEPRFRFAISRIEQAGHEIAEIAEIFPAESIVYARKLLGQVLDNLRDGQEFAASEYGFPINESMPT